jgi:fatty acid desaturase
MTPRDPAVGYAPEWDEPLSRFTERSNRPRAVHWYRTPLPPAALKRLHQRSDVRGAIQTLGYLGVLFGLGALAIYASFRWPWWSAVGCLLAYGLVASFLVNGLHELLHGTVFATRRLNEIFCPVVAFLGLWNYEHIQMAHKSHHRNTLHPPDDIEIPLPQKLTPLDFWKSAAFNYRRFGRTLRKQAQLAAGRFEDFGEEWTFPRDRPELVRPTVRWARILLGGHLAVLGVSLAMGWWMVPLVVTFGSFIGNGPFWLCNVTQHLGLPERNPDFRLCCRSFTVNPVVGFLYWHMNFHIEHHMYAAVPCYRLAELHRLIRYDLPPTPDGIAATWREIWPILRRQAAEPDWIYTPALPPGAGQWTGGGARPSAA